MAGHTSNWAEINFAFLLRAGPTALKFLSLSSAYNSSDEFRMNFLGSKGTSGGPDVPWLATNFSGGNFTVAAMNMHYTWAETNEVLLRLQVYYVTTHET